MTKNLLDPGFRRGNGGYFQTVHQAGIGTHAAPMLGGDQAGWYNAIT